jgi:hypothetical protein
MSQRTRPNPSAKEIAAYLNSLDLDRKVASAARRGVELGREYAPKAGRAAKAGATKAGRAARTGAKAGAKYGGIAISAIGKHGGRAAEYVGSKLEGWGRRENPSAKSAKPTKRASDIADLIVSGKVTARSIESAMVDAMAIDKKMRAEESGYGNHEAIDGILNVANSLFDGHGIEPIRGKWHDRYYQDIVALYVNMGDTYNTTLLFDAVKTKFYVTSWGDFVESKSRLYEIE